MRVNMCRYVYLLIGGTDEADACSRVLVYRLLCISSTTIIQAIELKPNCNGAIAAAGMIDSTSETGACVVVIKDRRIRRVIGIKGGPDVGITSSASGQEYCTGSLHQRPVLNAIGIQVVAVFYG